MHTEICPAIGGLTRKISAYQVHDDFFIEQYDLHTGCMVLVHKYCRLTCSKTLINGTIIIIFIQNAIL